MKVLVAVDSSTTSHHALLQALKLLNLKDATFFLLSVEEIVSRESSIGLADPLGMRTEMPFDLSEERELVDMEKKRTESALEWAQRICQQAGVKCTTHLVIGAPGQIICNIAEQEKPNIIVLGSEKRGMLERALVGSVSEYVLHHTQFPVLIVPEETLS